MKRLLLMMSLFSLSSTLIPAQTLTSITIGLQPSGAMFVVDGTIFTSTQVFEWPSGSGHIVQFPTATDPSGNPLGYQEDLNNSTHYIFGGWNDSTGLLAPTGSQSITVTASPSLTSLIGSVEVQYRVHIDFGNTNPGVTNCGGGPNSPSQAGFQFGIIYVNGACVANTTDSFQAAGSLNLNAFPYPGWVFYAWQINGFQSASTLLSYTLTGPTAIVPLFSIAKRVNFMTSPPQLQVLVDRSPIQTPANPTPADGSCVSYYQLPPSAPTGFPALCIGSFDFIPGSKHQIGAVSPQMDGSGAWWVFAGFSNGQGQNSVYTAGTDTTTQDTLTADFVSGIPATITTIPGGLHITVDGNASFPPPYNYVWGIGQTHTVAAPAQQTDKQGRVWIFSSWSNGGSASQTVTVPSAGSLVMNATYTELGQAQVTSNPPGLSFVINGSPCTTPCTLNQSTGAQVQISIPASISAGTNTQYNFQSWSDGNTATTRTVSFTQGTLSLTANYQTSYLLFAVSNPANAGSFTFSPASAGGYYPVGTAVAVTVAANNGYKFSKWENNLGTYATLNVTMSSPQTVTADFTSVPYIAPAGIQTAAGPTPDGTVAPGSLIAIYGQGFAQAMQIGQSNPLQQSIENVTVTVNNQILPLLFVSPGQIAAQLPWEVQPGDYTLVIHSSGQPDINGQITVSRDAPALFQLPNTQNLPLVLALHQDGTVIDANHPALRDEQISLYGTGFGPFTAPVPDGFPVPSTDTNVQAVDPVTITCGGVQVQPDSVGPAPGMVGMTLVKMTIGSALPSATTANLTVSVSGNISSPVSLPLQ